MTHYLTPPQMELVVIPAAQLEALISRLVSQALSTANIFQGAKETKLLTVAEAAKFLRRSEKMVRDLIRAGQLTAVNQNAGTTKRPAYRLASADLEAYVKAQRR